MVIFKMSFAERINLRPISLNDTIYLYELLKERNSSITITQIKLPNFDQHKIFVQNQIFSINGNSLNIKEMKLDAYIGWYIIESDEKNLGSIWIEEDGNIGLQIQKKFQNIGIGIIAFQKIQGLHHKDIYKTTVSPENKDSINFCKQLDFQLLKKTNDRLIFYKSIKN